MSEFTFDKPGLKRLDIDIAEALQGVAEKHGINVALKGGSYDPTIGEYKPKVVFEADDAAEKDFRRWAEVYGLSADDYGREFKANGGKTFKVSGIRSRSRKAPIICSHGGREYVFAADVVVRALNASDTKKAAAKA